MRRVPPGRSLATSTGALFLAERERRCRGALAGLGGRLRLIPGVRSGQPIAERCHRLPSELDAGPLVRHRAGLEISRARLAELDDALADEFGDRFGDLLDAHRYGTLDVVRAVDGHFVERLHMGLRQVFDVDERALLAAVAVDAQRLTPHAPLHEGGDDAVVAHPRAVGDAV